MVLAVGLGSLLLLVLLRHDFQSPPGITQPDGFRSLRPDKRVEAIRELEQTGRSNPKAAIPLLIRSLNDTDSTVRSTAALAFVSVVPGEAGATVEDFQTSFSALLKSVDDPSPNVSLTATQAIGFLMNSCRPQADGADLTSVGKTLLNRLSNPDADIRLGAIRSLGFIGPRIFNDCPTPLVAALHGDLEKHRDAAAEALLNYRQALPGLLPSLMRGFQKERADSRTAYLKILERSAPPKFGQEVVPGLLAALDSTDPEFHRIALTNVARFKQEAASALPALLVSLDRVKNAPSTEPEAREVISLSLEILKAIRETGPHALSTDAAATFVKVSHAAPAPVRKTAIETLGVFYPSEQLLTMLTELIDDKDQEVRISALRAIQQVHFPRPYAPPAALGSALEDQSSDDIRIAAAHAIGSFGDGVDPFISVFLRHVEHEKSQLVRGTFSTMFSELRPPNVTTAILPTLISALSSPSTDVKVAASKLISRFGPDASSAVPPLLRMMKEGSRTNVYEQDYAALALARMTRGTPQADLALKEVMETLDTSTYPSWDLVQAIALFGPKASIALPRLKKLQEHSTPFLREAAKAAIERIQSEK